MGTERQWLVAWMYGIAAVHLLVGLALPWLGGWNVLDGYHQSVGAEFWPGGAPAAARAQQEWWMALFGPTVQSLSLWMAALTYFGDRYRSRFAWGSLLAGVLLWAPQDVLFSLRADAWVHVWVDCIAVATMVPPLLMLWRLDRVPPEASLHRGEGELFKKILGPAWQELHPDIQARFDKNPAPGKPLRYTGELSELACSRVGKLLGHLTMPLVKGALIPYSDKDFPVDIEVYAKPGCDAIFKQRVYRLNRRRPIQFTSYMRESEKGEVLEYVGMGLGMKLVLKVHEGNLYFTSDGYFWDLFGWRMPLPDLLTPGRTFLCHRNDHPDQFNIRISIEHPWFGKTFSQVGVFREVAA